MRINRNRKKVMSEINVVPYIDVMLVLLIIFMITAPLLSQGVKVDLPRASAKALVVSKKGPIIVSVDKLGRYYLNVSEKPNIPINASEMITRIVAELTISKQSGENRTVVVKGDRDVDYGKIVQLMVLLQNAGIEKVGLMTEELERKVV